MKYDMDSLGIKAWKVKPSQSPEMYPVGLVVPHVPHLPRFLRRIWAWWKLRKVRRAWTKAYVDAGRMENEMLHILIEQLERIIKEAQSEKT